GQPIRQLERNDGLPPAKGRCDRLCEALARELMGARQKPDIVIVPHPAVRATEYHHGMKFLRDNGFTRIGPQAGRWQIEHDRKLDFLHLRFDCIAKADVYDYSHACPAHGCISFESQPAISLLFANAIDAELRGVKFYAIVDLYSADVAEDIQHRRGIGAA